MNKQFVRWKAFEEETYVGTRAVIPIAEELDIQHKGTLLSQILSMEQKTPMSYEDAMHLTHRTLKKCWTEKKLSAEFGHFQWYMDNFCDWISHLGYHIELTGDEFEIYFGVSPT